jgi:hypothetical protein
MRQEIYMAIVLLSLAACSRKEEEKVALAAPAAALTISKPAPEAKVTEYVLDREGTTAIDMPAPKERIKARTTAAAGSLEIDLTNLANSRGEVRIDLTTLTTSTFGDKEKDEAQTEHARTWLEAVVGGKVKEEHRWAVFAIRSVYDLSATDVANVAPVREGSDDVRVVTLTARGDFLLHGRKSPKDVKLAARLRYPAGAAADATPTSIEIRSVAPMHIVLAEHEVMPRDTFGKVAQGSLHLLGTKVADTADVSIDVRASKAVKS